MKDLLASKKFRVALLTVVGMIVGKLGVPEATITELTALVSPLLAFIVGQGLADVGKERAKIEARADQMGLPKIVPDRPAKGNPGASPFPPNPNMT